MEIVERLFAQYGYLVLLIGLPMELIASLIPPGNSTTCIHRIFILQKCFSIFFQPLPQRRILRSVLGITTTYWIGKQDGYATNRKIR